MLNYLVKLDNYRLIILFFMQNAIIKPKILRGLFSTMEKRPLSILVLFCLFAEQFGESFASKFPHFIELTAYKQPVNERFKETARR